jgi:very-short-patch-repair endonuclease
VTWDLPPDVPLPDDADALTCLLCVQHGTISRLQALAHMSRAALRNLVDSGRWRRTHAGVFVAHNGSVTVDQRRWIASLAAGGAHPALIGGRSALAVQGLKGFPPDRIDVLLPAGRRKSSAPANVIVHRTRHLPSVDVDRLGRPPSTTAARAVVDAAAWARSEREAATVIAMAFQQRLVGLGEVVAVLERMPNVKRRRLIRTSAGDAAGGAHSLAELDVVRLLRRANLPSPTLQFVRTDCDGRRRYLDLYFERWRLHVEIDGAHHADPRRAWADMERQNALWVSGERLLRFPTWLVREQPATVVAKIRDALVQAGWRPRAAA